MEQSAQVSNIAIVRQGKKTRLFTSAVSATAIVSLFVVLMVELLARI